MKIVALTEGPEHVCCRYRIEAFRPTFAARGWTLEVAPLEQSAWGRVAQFRRLRSADVVVLQRKLLPWWQLCALRSCSRTLVFDFDDAVYGRDSYARKGHRSLLRKNRFWATVRAADAVLAGNTHLCEQAAAFVGRERVHFAPTCVDPQRYSLAGHAAVGGEMQLVWIGQRSTLPSLYCMQAQLQAAAAAVPGLGLRAVSDVFPELPGVRVVPRPWSAVGEGLELALADVGVSWLPDDAWSRGKCGLKVLQYMAAGLPVIANPLGVHRDMIVDGQTGFLAETPEEWARAMSRLAADADLRRTMGAAGRNLLEERYSVAAWSGRLASMLGETARRRQSRPAANLPHAMRQHTTVAGAR